MSCGHRNATVDVRGRRLWLCPRHRDASQALAVARSGRVSTLARFLCARSWATTCFGWLLVALAEDGFDLGNRALVIAGPWLAPQCADATQPCGSVLVLSLVGVDLGKLYL